MIRRAKGRDQAAMHRLAVEPNSTGAAVTAIATFLDPEPTEFANEGSQALARARFCLDPFPVNLVAHKLCSGRQALANLLGKIVGEVLTMRRRPVRVIEVEAERYRLIQFSFQLFRRRDILEPQLNGTERRGCDRQDKVAPSQGADQQTLRASQMGQRKTAEGIALFQ